MTFRMIGVQLMLGSFRRHSRIKALALFGLCAAMALGSGAFAGEPTPRATFWHELPAGPGVDLDAPVAMGAFASLARRLSPAVVNVHTVRAGGDDPSSFFKNPGGSGLGSGFIVREDGYVLTNFHVVRGAESIRVRLASDSAYPATVVGTFPLLDVALLKFEPDEVLAVAPLGDSNQLAIGEWVVAIGSPFGLDHTVTAGIVSAKGRRDVVPGREQNLARFLQTDASINPGSSGGPLINIRGEVVGINTAINPSGQGIGFAVPINMVKTVLPQLKEGRVLRSFLGVRFSAVPPEVVARARKGSTAQAGRRLHRGAWVREVVAGGPAAKAKLKVGDIILAWNGVPLADWEEVSWLAATTGAGQTVAIVLLRDDGELSVKVVLGAYPEEPEVTEAVPPAGGKDTKAAAPPLGIEVGAVSKADRRTLKLEPGQGVTVVSVKAGSVVAALGIVAGDVIARVNGELVLGGRRDFHQRVDAVGLGELLALEIRREGSVVVKAYTR